MGKFPANFEIANKFTQKWEKGYVNHPNDPGGATYNGVSLRFLKDTGIDVNGDGHIDAKDIRYLRDNNRQDLVDDIFYKAFWRDPNLDRFPYLPIQTVVYDANVNTGRTQSAKFLQRACNDLSHIMECKNSQTLVVDGIIGPKTCELVHFLATDDNGLQLAVNFLSRRLDFHNMLVKNSPYPDGRNYTPFAAGWRNRVNDLAKYIKGL